MEYFKDKLFPEFFKFILNLLSGILLLYAGLALKNSFEKSDGILFSFNFSPAVSILVYAVYFSLFLYFVWRFVNGIRLMIFSYVDHLQDEYVSPPDIDLDEFETESFRPFKYFSNRKYDSFIFRLRYAHVGDFYWMPDALLVISEPKCSEEKCATDLVIKRSYFGFYKYTCPACKKKYLSMYDASTLKSNLKKVIFAEKERESDELPF
ncbi:hypothetical protein ACQR3P_31965 [Rhodococcus sp. IEGM1300]